MHEQNNGDFAIASSDGPHFVREQWLIELAFGQPILSWQPVSGFLLLPFWKGELLGLWSSLWQNLGDHTERPTAWYA